MTKENEAGLADGISSSGPRGWLVGVPLTQSGNLRTRPRPALSDRALEVMMSASGSQFLSQEDSPIVRA